MEIRVRCAFFLLLNYLLNKEDIYHFVVFSYNIYVINESAQSIYLNIWKKNILLKLYIPILFS